MCWCRMISLCWTAQKTVAKHWNHSGQLSVTLCCAGTSLEKTEVNYTTLNLNLLKIWDLQKRLLIILGYIFLNESLYTSRRILVTISAICLYILDPHPSGSEICQSGLKSDLKDLKSQEQICTLACVEYRKNAFFKIQCSILY